MKLIIDEKILQLAVFSLHLIINKLYCQLFLNNNAYSSSLFVVRIFPGCNSSSDKFSMRFLINRNVGWPTFAVIFLTCLFLPSVNINFIQLVGIFFLKRIGGFLSATCGNVKNFSALHGFVLYHLPSTV